MAPRTKTETLEQWTEDWKNEKLRILDGEWYRCTRCDLHKTRTQTVFARGDVTASFLVIGDAPGEEEDVHGEPFVGEAGTLLEQMLEEAGIPENDVLFTNTVLCLPPKFDRTTTDPSVAQMKACRPRLDEIIQIIDPLIIIPVGGGATKYLMKTTKRRGWTSVLNAQGKLGTIHVSSRELPGVLSYSAMPIVHPSYILRTDAIDPKTDTWAKEGHYWKTIHHLKRAKRIVDGLKDRQRFLAEKYGATK